MRLRHRAINAILNILWMLTRSGDFSRPLPEAVRSLLRRFPFWINGHITLGEIYLSDNSISAAYACAQCARALANPGSSYAAAASFLLGRCHLRRGDWSTALPLLREARSLRPRDCRINEEEAAALLLAGNHAEALTTLQSIPESRLSAEGKAALAFARSKVNCASTQPR